MLPAILKSLGTLPLVFSSALASVLGRQNELNLAPARSAAVILVDGLGRQNLSQRDGHAPFLSKLNAVSKHIYSDFPSTTATSLTGFGTGLRAAEHGILGYTVVDDATGEVRNMLSGWARGKNLATGSLLKQWQRKRRIAEHTPTSLARPSTKRADSPS